MFHKNDPTIIGIVIIGTSILNLCHALFFNLGTSHSFITNKGATQLEMNIL